MRSPTFYFQLRTGTAPNNFCHSSFIKFSFGRYAGLVRQLLHASQPTHALTLTATSRQSNCRQCKLCCKKQHIAEASLGKFDLPITFKCFY